MIRIAIQSLFHEKGKLFAALAGVSFAASLVLAQTGLYMGFQKMATNVVLRVGGDLWVMARGTKLLDMGSPVSAGSRAFVAAHPCVERARGLVFDWAMLRKPSGGTDNVQIIGYEPDERAVLPWSIKEGLPHDLHAPMRIAVDAADLERLEIAEPAIGQPVELNGQKVFVGAVTEGVRSFTVVPYLFAEVHNAQRIFGLSDTEYTYWALDLRDPSCQDDVVRAVERNGDLVAHTNAAFRQMTSDYWILKSGAGATLAFAALLGLIVGVVIVGQTLYSLAENRLEELATWKAMGAAAAELVGFVGWQAAFLAFFGGGMGVLLALGMKKLVVKAGLTIVLSPGVLALGLGCVVAMCALASLASVRKVLTVEAASVFK
jgi:putative ABC transport system permease protein